MEIIAKIVLLVEAVIRFRLLGQHKVVALSLQSNFDGKLIPWRDPAT